MLLFCHKLCPALCDFIDCSPPGSSVHGIFQARIPERAAISFFKGPPNPGVRPASPAWQVDSSPLRRRGSPDYNAGNNTLIVGKGGKWDS